MQRRAFLGLAGAAFVTGAGAAETPEFSRLPAELANTISELPGLVLLGPKAPDVTVYEFFDYNCPYCKQSSRDVRALLAGDPGLGYGLVNFAVLGRASIEATRVALAFRADHDPAAYLTFHERLFALRGAVNGLRAVEVATGLGAKSDDLLEAANSDGVTAAMIAAVKLGDALGFGATPSYAAGVEGFSGSLAPEAKRRVIANLRACERTRC